MGSITPYGSCSTVQESWPGQGSETSQPCRLSFDVCLSRFRNVCQGVEWLDCDATGESPVGAFQLMVRKGR